MLIILNILATLAVAIVAIPAIFKGRMKDSFEIYWLATATLSLCLSLLVLIKPGFFTFTLCIANTALLFSPQGRYFLVELFTLPLEIANRLFHAVRNIVLEEKSIYNWEFFHKLREELCLEYNAKPNTSFRLELEDKRIDEF